MQSCTQSESLAGMYRLDDPTFHRVEVGKYRICSQREGKIWIERIGEEASEFDVALVEAAIEAMFDANF